MPLDLNKPLPMTDGATSRRRRGGVRRLCGLFLLLLLAGGAFAYWGEPVQEQLRDGMGAAQEGATEMLSSLGVIGAEDPADATAPEATVQTVSPAAGDESDANASGSAGSGTLMPAADGEAAGDSLSEMPGDGGGPLLPEDAGAAAETASEQAPQPSATDALRKQWRRVGELERAGDSEALRTALQEILAAHPDDRHGANARYRLAVLDWSAGNQDAAKEQWKQAYVQQAETIGGRLSALVLADLWYKRYCEADPPAYRNWEAVRDAYSAAIGKDRADFLSSRDRLRARERLMRLNEYLVFSREPCRDAEYYTVRKGDSLEAIAKRYEVHFDGIAAINGLRKSFIRVGEKLKIIRFSSIDTEAVVDKGRQTLTLYHKGKWLKEYPICHGGKKTIPGNYTIVRKSADPEWTDPKTGKVYGPDHPKNILGDRWLSFDGSGPSDGMGIHGTTLPESIPGDSSNGCVRMYNADVKEVYGILIRGSRVTVYD